MGIYGAIIEDMNETYIIGIFCWILQKVIFFQCLHELIQQNWDI